MNWKEVVFTLVRDREMTGETYRVLLVILAESNGEKPVFFSQVEIGAITGMKQQNVSRSLSKLMVKRIIYHL